MQNSVSSSWSRRFGVVMVVVLLLALALPAVAADAPPEAVETAVSASLVLTDTTALVKPAAADPLPPIPEETGAALPTGQGAGAPIQLRVGTLDPSRGIYPDLPVGLRLDGYSAGRGYYILQFVGPVQEAWKAEVSALGVQLFDYIPDFAFVAAMDGATREAVAALKEVAIVEVFQPGYKLHPELVGATGVQELLVQTFPAAPLAEVAALSQALGAAVQDGTEDSDGGLLHLHVDAAELPALAHIPAVRWIEPFYERVLHNDIARSNTIMAAETAWTDLGLYGAGQVVAVADTGLDTGNLSTLAQDFLGGPTSCSGTGRIIATFALGRTNNWSDSCGTSSGGHGTHVSGSVLGNGCRSGSGGQPSGYANSYAGLAPQAGLVMQSVMSSNCGLGGLPSDLNTLFNQARDAGARIHTNSWGAAVAGQYTTDSRNSDLFLWNNKNQMVLFSAGNAGVDKSPADGFIDLDSIGAPGTAKNVITVGASENLRLSGGYNPGGPCSTWGGCWPSDYPTNPIKDDRLSDNASGMVAFSSRGPTDDGRLKPDVVAPGSNILSTKSQAASGVGGGWGAGPNQYYQYMGGTSMATPLTAGAMAQIREFYTRIKSITPSGALLKATVINSAVNMHPGQYASPLEQQPPLPNNAQGWGRVNVANAVDDSHLWQDISDANGLATGGSQSYTYPYCGTSPLKVTLVWTDYPGATLASVELVNDLDLTLTAPNGTVYRGNVFSNGWAATGGSADRRNNVESVYVQSPAAGNWTVTVSGYNVPNGMSGKQGYALVVDGVSGTCDDFTVSAAPAVQDVCAPADGSYAVTVGKMGSFSSPVTLSASGHPAGTTASFSANPVTPPGASTLTISNTGAAVAGAYNITVTGTSGALSHSANVTLNIATPLAAAPALNAPADGSTGVATTPTFAWGAVAGAASYEIQVATDPVFANIVASASGLNGTSWTPGSALAPDTTYYWRVRASNACGAGVYSSVFTFTTLSRIITCNGAGGNWDSASTWSPSGVPTAIDQVVISNGCTVTINTNATIDSLTVGGGASGILQFEQTTARTLTVNGSVTIASGGTFRSNTAGAQTGHRLSVGTDLTNNGVLDFSTNNNTAGAQITFTGAADASFTLNSGSTTDLRPTTGVALNKGTSSAPVLTFTPGGALTVQGANTAGFLAITNGTFKLGGSNSFSNPVFNVAAYTIPATGGFWLDNPNATVAGLNGSPTNNGTLRISQGTYTVGTSSGNSMGAGTGANFLIEGGTLNATGRLYTANAVNYTQSGGAVNVATVANAASNLYSFGLGNNSATTISGGTITLVQINSTSTPANRRDYGVFGTANITGGALNVGTSATSGNSGNFDFRIQGQAPAVVLNNAANNKNALLVGQLNVWGDLTVNSGTTLNANGNTVLLLGPNAVNNGAIVGTATGSRFDFVGSAAQTYGGTGVFGTTAAPFLSVGIGNGSGATLNAPIVTNRVNLFEGTFTNSNQFTLGNGGASATVVQIGQASSTTPGGNFDVNPTFNTGTGGHYILYAQETVARTTGPEIPPSRTAYYVAVDNTNGVTLAGGDLTIVNTSAQTSSVLTLTNGRFALDANNLIIVNNAIGGSPFSADKMIVADGSGALCKRFTANGSFLYPIGDVTGTPEYSPATLNFTAGSYGSGAQACVNLTGAKHPNMPGDDYITRYWTVTQNNISGFTSQVAFTYVDADIVGSEANLWGAKWDAGWTVLNPVNQSANQFTASVNSFSAFSAGNAGPLAVLLAEFYAQQVADHVLLTWETNSELNNRGFNLYRGTSPDGPDRQLNETLIPSQSQGSPGGFLYTWEDHEELVPGTTYYYWLEDVDLNGVATRHGPVSVDFVTPTAVTLSGVSASPGLDTLHYSTAAALPALSWLAVVAGAGVALALGRRRTAE